MIENIRNEFKIMLFENNWMDYLSKKSALEKVLKILKIKIKLKKIFINNKIFY